MVRRRALAPDSRGTRPMKPHAATGTVGLEGVFSEVRRYGVLRSPTFLLHMVRKASREVLGVFLRDLGEAARLAAANTGDRVGHRLPSAPAVGRGYEGELVGAPPRQATLGDEDF